MTATTAILRGEVRATAKDGREFEAIAVTYGTVDSYGSVWARGVFDASLRDRLPVVAWGHSWEEPIGRVTAWRNTDRGLLLTGRLSDPEAVPRAKQAAAQLRDRDLTDVSVGFSGARRRPLTPEEEDRWPGAVEVIESATLDELSLVLRGAVPGASVTDVRRQGRAMRWTAPTVYPVGTVEARWIGEVRRRDAALVAEADAALDGLFRGRP